VGADAIFAVLIGCLVMSALAMVLNRFILRHFIGRPAVSAIMVTLGLGAAIRGAASFWPKHVPASLEDVLPQDQVFLLGVSISEGQVWATLIALALIGGLAAFYKYSRAGLALRAIAEDQPAAMATGIHIGRYFILAWTIASILCVAAGVLSASISGGGFGLALVGLKVFPIVVIGGLDRIGGAFAAALLVGIVESLAAGYADPVVGAGSGGLASFALLLIVLLIRPHGLFGSAPAARV
jgi:branched-chain amino acid transport system permease protein